MPNRAPSCRIAHMPSLNKRFGNFCHKNIVRTFSISKIYIKIRMLKLLSFITTQATLNAIVTFLLIFSSPFKYINSSRTFQLAWHKFHLFSKYFIYFLRESFRLYMKTFQRKASFKFRLFDNSTVHIFCLSPSPLLLL